MVNPYEPTIAEAGRLDTTPIRQRWIVAVFGVTGLCSWASLLYAIKDIRIYTEPAYEQIIHYPGFWACAAFAWMCAATGFFGIGCAIRQQWHPWIVSLGYLASGICLCYAGGLVTTAYVMDWDM